MEIATSFQYFSSDKFLTGDKDTTQLFANFNSKYLYQKIGYGITKDFTVSVEAGYYINKTQVGLFDSVLNKAEEIESSGIADLIFFPKYDLVNRTDGKKRVELTLGLGYKIPLGKHDDSILVYTNPVTGQQLFTTAPPLVQPTNGSQDLIGYAFYFRGYPKYNFRVFTNALYIRKGWNSLGEKFGDYASIGLFAGKTFFEKLGVTVQLKADRTGKMKGAENVDLLAFYNIDTASTGSKKLAAALQLSFSINSWTLFGLAETPLYENVNGTQIASKLLLTFGVSYRFFTYKSFVPKSGETVYVCPMNCKGSASNKPGKCKVCDMDLEEQKGK